MNRNPLKALYDDCLSQSGGDQTKASHTFATRLSTMIDSGQITDTSRLSLRQLYQLSAGHIADITDPSVSVEQVALAVNTTGFRNITDKVLANTTLTAYDDAMLNLGALVDEYEAEKHDGSRIVGTTAAVGFQRRPSGDGYLEVQFGEKYVDIDLMDFGQIVSLTREMIEDDRTGQVQDRARSLGERGGQVRARMITHTLECAARTDLGESSSRAYVPGGTAITSTYFYSTDHSSTSGLDGQTNANVDTTDSSDITTVGLTALRSLFGIMTDEQGEKIAIVPNTLVVPPALYVKAAALVRSGTQPDTMDRNSINFFQGTTLVENPYLSSTAYYYYGRPKHVNGLRWAWVWRPETRFQGADSDLSFSNQIAARFRFNFKGGCGWGDYKYIARGGN